MARQKKKEVDVKKILLIGGGAIAAYYLYQKFMTPQTLLTAPKTTTSKPKTTSSSGSSASVAQYHIVGSRCFDNSGNAVDGSNCGMSSSIATPVQADTYAWIDVDSCADTTQGVSVDSSYCAGQINPYGSSS